MRIAINAMAVGPGMTGIGSYARDLVQATAQYGQPHSYYYFSANPDTCLPVAPHVRTVRVLSPDAMWEQLHLPTELAAQRADLYHSPLFTCPLVQEVPSIVTLHDVIPERRPDLCSPAFLGFYHKWIEPSLRAAKAVLTVSEFSRQEIISCRDIAPEKVHSIHQAIPEAFFSPAQNIAPIKAKYALPHQYILYVGMIEPRKNLELLLRAFKPLSRRLKDIALVLVGRKDSPEYDLGPTIDNSGLAGRVLQLGYVPDGDLPAIYSGACVFAFPSLYEGFGRPVVEAMASGTPVLASATTSLPEIMDGAGLAIDPANEEMVADGLLRLAEDHALRKRLSEHGRLRAKEFTLAKFGERLRRFYEEIGAMK